MRAKRLAVDLHIMLGGAGVFRGDFHHETELE